MIKGQNRKVIEGIQNKVFDKYGKKILKEEIIDNRWIYDAAMKDKKISREGKEKLKKAYDSGAFYEKKIVEDDKVAQKMDTMMNAEMKRAFRDGRLEKKADSYAKNHIKH